MAGPIVRVITAAGVVERGAPDHAGLKARVADGAQHGRDCIAAHRGLLRSQVMSRRALVLAGLLSSAGTAWARPVDYVVVDPPRERGHGGGAHTIYLNRCADGCTVRRGSDDSIANTSSILGRDNVPAEISLAPFGWDDTVWDGMVACVRERYAPWNVTIVTDEPANGRYLEVMVGGLATSLGLNGNTLGVAPLTSDCSPLPSAIAFAFANAHQPPDQIENLCTTVIHEAGHLYGLDHEFACRDPMTYLTDCGEKLFVNRSFACGEFDGPRPCKCGATQNSFAKLNDAIGPGAPPAPPSTVFELPSDGATVGSRFSAFVSVTSLRPVADMELWVNGWPWVRVPGKPEPGVYELPTPAELPDGVLDLEVRTRDDLGNVAVVRRTVQKGAACTDASTCLDGQSCGDGRCRYPAATGGLGDACTADEQCAEKLCVAVDGEAVCSQPCFPEGASCNDGLACRAGDDEGFACLPPAPDDGGCCSGAADPGATGVLLVLGLGVWRRRRQRRPAR